MGMNGEPMTLPDAVSTDSTEQNMGLIGEPIPLPDVASLESQMAEAFPSPDSGAPSDVDFRFQCHCGGSCTRFWPVPDGAVGVETIGPPLFSPHDRRLLCCCYCISKFKKRRHRETPEVVNLWRLAGICSFCYELFHSAELLDNHVAAVHRRPPDQERVSASSRRIAAIRMRI
ncbi:uncharacterized protein LOC142813970 [Rhipicephalus microplus]|uniref:uncharacterized protein LOC142813970 n=1 Tax=Rhipicephalus microplus TaxID=6941 RepID=UPI003F6CF160